MFITLALLAISNCSGEHRDDIIRKAFVKNNNNNLTTADVTRYVHQLPWFARTAFELYFAEKGGVHYIMNRCGENGVVTLETALKKVDTCITRCLYLAILQAIT